MPSQVSREHKPWHQELLNWLGSGLRHLQQPKHPRCLQDAEKFKTQSSCSPPPFIESNTKTHHKSDPQPPGSQPGPLHYTALLGMLQGMRFAGQYAQVQILALVLGACHSRQVPLPKCHSPCLGTEMTLLAPECGVVHRIRSTGNPECLINDRAKGLFLAPSL